MIIIPCAGYGTRMNMDPNKSKEMLIDPVTNQPLIQWTLDRAKEVNQKSLVITRHKKTDLIEYCKQQPNVEILILEEDTFDWAETVLKSESYWEEKNALLLPDLRFSSVEIFKIAYERHWLMTTIATHRVPDGQNWGIVSREDICEKPKGLTDSIAWGFIIFNKLVGNELFTNMKIKNIWFPIPKPWTSFCLENAVDITRTGKLTTYE